MVPKLDATVTLRLNPHPSREPTARRVRHPEVQRHSFGWYGRVAHPPVHRRNATVPTRVQANTIQAPATCTRNLVGGSNAPRTPRFIISKWMKKRATATAG